MIIYIHCCIENTASYNFCQLSFRKRKKNSGREQVLTSRPSTDEVISHVLRVAWTRPSCPSSKPPPSLLAPYNLHKRNQKDHHKAKTKKISVTILTMAAIIIAKNAMLNLSKALIPQPPSLSPTPRLKSHGSASLPMPPNITRYKSSFKKLTIIYMGMYWMLFIVEIIGGFLVFRDGMQRRRMKTERQDFLRERKKLQMKQLTGPKSVRRRRKNVLRKWKRR